MVVKKVYTDINRIACDAILEITAEDLKSYKSDELAQASQITSARVFDELHTYVIHVIGPTSPFCLVPPSSYPLEGHFYLVYSAAVEYSKKLGCKSLAVPLLYDGEGECTGEKALDIVEQVFSENEMYSQLDMQIYVVLPRETNHDTQSYQVELERYISDTYYQTDHEDILENSIGSYGKFLTIGPARENSGWDSESTPDETPAYTVSAAKNIPNTSLTDWLQSIDETFQQKLLKLIKRKQMTETECYTKAGISRQVFSKIRGNIRYQPSRSTAICLAIALELDIEEATDLFRSAGFALSHSNLFDIIIEFFIVHKKYDFYEINLALDDHHQELLGAEL